jgi:hypothetical protein
MGYESVIMQYSFQALDFFKILVIANLWNLSVARCVSLWRAFDFGEGGPAEWRQFVSRYLSLG